MAFNRLADRHIDAANPRTAGRHLPTGQLTPAAVGLFTVLCAAGFVAATALFLLAEPPNLWPLLLSVPVLLFVCGYSFTKRFTALAHFWLGVSLLLAPLASVDCYPGTLGFGYTARFGIGGLFLGGGFRRHLRLPGY